MNELNPNWLPIVRIEPPFEPLPDPIERALRIIWSYERNPPRVSVSQRYSLSLTETLPEPVWRKA